MFVAPPRADDSSHLAQPVLGRGDQRRAIGGTCHDTRGLMFRTTATTRTPPPNACGRDSRGTRRRAVDRPQQNSGVASDANGAARSAAGRPIIAIANRNAHIVVAETLGFQLRTRSIRGTVGSLGNFD